MPKVRPTLDIIRDAQRFLAFARSRMYREKFNQNLLAEITDISSKLDAFVIKMPQEPTNDLDRIISNEINLIKKETIKEIPKIDYRAAVRAIYNSTNGSQALKAGLSHGLNEQQIKVIVKKIEVEMPNSNLGRVIARAKPAQTQQTTYTAQVTHTPADIESIESDDTINSDIADAREDMQELLSGE